MPESVDPRDEGPLEPIRLPDGGLEDLDTSVRRLLRDQSQEQARLLDSLSALPASYPAFPMPAAPTAPGEARFILSLDGVAYESELDALTDWVDTFLDEYQPEVSTAAPWCYKWHEHVAVVGWLHALWTSYQQHQDPEAGGDAMLVWHRDFLTHALAAVRAPGGALSACTTDPERPSHRLLPGPNAARKAAHAEPPLGSAS